MGKILMINGSPNEKGCTFTALSEVASTLKKHGLESEIVYLGKKAVQGCIACMFCRSHGRCVFNDMVNELGARLEEFDAIIAGSPVYYAGPTGQVCSFLDRFFFSNSGKFKGKPGASVVSCRRGGAASAFDRLNKYFTIANMPLVSSQYWNMVHGFTPEDVRKDLEGLQTMRTLGENMAWLLESIKAGKSHNVKSPAYEEVVYTNFIGG